MPVNEQITTIVQFGLLLVLLSFWVFRLLVLLKIIPPQLVWGGRFSSAKQMYQFELAAIVAITGLILVVVASLGIPIGLPRYVIRTIFWLMVGLFALNTLGNWLSKNPLEKKLFTPITAVLALLSLTLVLNS